MLSLRDKIHPARGLEADATLGAWLRSGEAEDTGWKPTSVNLTRGAPGANGFLSLRDSLIDVSEAA